MNITNYVLQDVRKFLNIEPTSNVFDGEIIPHVTSGLGKLSQNGVVVAQALTETTTWHDIIVSEFLVNPEVFTMVPLYLMLSTKILFDPPPPSTLEYYQNNISDLLWRLRTIYDTREVT